MIMKRLEDRKKIEILVPEILVRKVIAIAKQTGITGYTIFPAVGGSGEAGAWSDDQLSGADAHVMIMMLASEAKAENFVIGIEPLLDSHQLILTVSSVSVLRSEKF